ncbi:MAG: efflux RND transporter periplasmic adaptor subunit [Chloroflexota bacterium]
MRRFLILAIVVVVIGGGLLAMRQGSQAQSTTDTQTQILDQTTSEMGDLRLTVSATGGVTPKRQVPLLFASSGVVEQVFVKAGDTVKVGDELAQLDTTDLQSAFNDAQVQLQMQQIAYNALTSPPRDADLALAQAAVTAAQAALNAAYGSSDPNAAQIAQLRSDLARNQLWQAQLQRDMSANATGFAPDISGLIPDGVDVPPEVIQQLNQGLAGLVPSIPSLGGVSDESLDQAQYGIQIADANAAAAADQGADPGSVASANAAVVSAQQQLNRLKNGPSDYDLQAAEISLNLAQLAVEQAQTALDNAMLVAPFDGIIAQNHLVEGEVPPSDNAALLLVDDDTLYVDLAIDETDVVKLSEGQRVELTFDALPDSGITGQVTRIGTSPTIAGQLVTYPVRVTLDPTDQPVRIGMSATATIIVDQLDNVLIVPNRFIRIDRTTQDAYVTVEDDKGKFSEIPVQLGLRNELNSQISGGLKAGQQIFLLPRASFNPLG